MTESLGREPSVELPEYLEDHDLANVPSSAAPRAGLLRFARMAGSSIAGRDAAVWVTDFLNAAYYRRRPEGRDVDDLRLAFCTLTTYWYRKDGRRRLHITDLPAFHLAFGKDRLSSDDSSRGTLNRSELLDGASRLLGDWFPAAYADDARRAWGIAFESVADRDAYDPAYRMALARVGQLTPERAPAAERTWHTYPQVAMPSVEGVVAALTAPERWPDFASEIGRFTPLRAGGLDGQIFEIEVAAGTDSGRPIFTRGYITITKLLTSAQPDELAGWVRSLEEGLARYGEHEPPALPPGGEALVGFDLTTHQGHFMGNGHNRLLLYTHEGTAWVRAAGTWDPMPWHIEQTYRIAGREAQHAFWGEGNVLAQSMLHQLALQVAR
jgi:hypothetical protein